MKRAEPGGVLKLMTRINSSLINVTGESRTKVLKTIDALTNICKLKTYEERMTLVTEAFSWAVDEEYEESVKSFKTSKDGVKSSIYRCEGNSAFEANSLTKALELYNCSIAHAPLHSEELSYAYANRSAVLKEMGKFHACILDIQTALDCGYPNTLKYKLLFREALCLRDLGKSDLGNETFDLAIEALELAELSENEKCDLKRKISRERFLLHNVNDEKFQIFLSCELPSLKQGPSAETPSASSCVQLCYNDTYGRHMAANTDINIGDILIVEDPFTMTVDFSMRFKLCTHCHNPAFALLPCPDCAWVMFCSEKCLQEALEKYHKVECLVFSKFLALLEEDAGGFGEMLIRCVAKLGFENFLKISETHFPAPQNKEENRTQGFNSNGKYDTCDFLTVKNLVGHISTNSSRQQVSLCLVALLITKCFDSTNYKKLINFSSLVLQLFDSFCRNTAAIKMLNICQIPTKDFDTEDEVVIGSGIYPTFSLLSHSCDCNSLFYYHGKTLILSATLPIRKGEQITVSYTHSFLSDDKKDRQSHLQSIYNFTCSCKACVNDWPKIEDLDSVYVSATNDQLKKLQSFKVQPLINKIVLGNYFKNKNILTTFLKVAIKQRADYLTYLTDKNKTLNSEFVDYRNELEYLMACYGTVINFK